MSNVEKIISKAEEYFRIPDIATKSQSRDFVMARSVVSHILHCNGYSDSSIGERLKKDRSSVCASRQRVHDTYHEELLRFEDFLNGTSPFIRDATVKLVSAYVSRESFGNRSDAESVICECIELAKIIEDKTK